MEAYQEQYLANTQKIAELSDLYRVSAPGSADTVPEYREAEARIAELRQDNIRLLNEYLFPALDSLFGASREVTDGLEKFAGRLMDWKTNLDCGLYVVIHKALLSLQRVRQDRAGLLRELYQLGMGYYYLHMYVSGMDIDEVRTMNFRNEMLFTEAASYLRFFEEIEDEESRGYIIRSMANIALCTKDRKRKIAIGRRILDIVRDPYYRALAPGLPWDVFLSRTHQQMSSCRVELSTGNLDREELAAVLDSCYEVFKAQQGQERPSVRWLWPLYEMEYSCGYADAETTLDRMEKLITQTPVGTYDMSGLYAGIRLPLYYSHMLRDNPRLADDPIRLRFMAYASERMLETILTCPLENQDTHFFYLVRDTVAEYHEFPGCVTYLDLSRHLLQRFAGALYRRGRKAGRILQVLCGAMLERFPDCFDELPFLRNLETPAEKRKALLEYAEGCGLYYDYGLLKINITRTEQTRNLFDEELEIYQLHCVSGWEDLKSRPSTRRYADVALGHHAWYNGAGGYPAFYERNRSPYRQMTDAATLAARLLETPEAPMAEILREISAGDGSRFSPVAAAVCLEPEIAVKLDEILKGDDPEEAPAL